MSGDPGFAGHYDAAIDQLLRFDVAIGETVADLLASHPEAPLAHVLAAYLPLLSTDPRDRASAVAALDSWSGGAHDATEREQLHLRAAQAWVDGRMAEAGRILDELLLASPRDVLALYVGHQIDFFTGNARHLRDRVGRSVEAFSAADDALGFLLGMLAFGLEECGDYRRAEAVGLEAIERHPADVWAIHAVVHCHEMQGDALGGAAFLDGIRTDWAVDNGFTVHNHWHRALFDLQLGRTDAVLARYDAELHNGDSGGVPIELLDATALLWRLHLAGVDVGVRWQPLVAAWAATADVPFYAFNDMHAVIAEIGAGRLAAAQAFVRSREQWLAGRWGTPDPAATNTAMTEHVGLPVCRALVEFGEERYAVAWRDLLEVRPVLHRFGGSHAQRDVVDLTIIEAARRDGRDDLLRALTSERRTRRG